MTSFDFDRKFEYIADGASVKYGVKYGDGRIVFIKVGLGGDIPGYEGKYLVMAERLRAKYGCSVICSSNPEGIKEQTELDGRAIADVARELRSESPELYLFGHSNGGIKGLYLTASGINFRRMVLVNMPLDEKLDNVLTQLRAIPETKIVAIFAEKVHSCESVSLLKNVDVIKTRDAYHSCKIAIDKFKELE